MDQQDLLNHFTRITEDDPNISHAVAAIKSLIEFISLSGASTLAGLRESLERAFETLRQTPGTSTSIRSGCELFLRFVTFTSLDHPDFELCKKVLVDRGKLFLSKLMTCRQKIAKMTAPFIGDGSKILIHARSRVVLQVLEDAVKAKKRFSVFVTESMPDKSGHLMAKDLVALGIPTTVILDAAVGFYIEEVDLVLCGAEGVVESGGIINKIGTYTMALSAKELNKPFYVVVESFKFTREYPLNQNDIPDYFKYQSTEQDSKDGSRSPFVDYTPPLFITLLFTDLGILTPSAVSDELIKLYC